MNYDEETPNTGDDGRAMGEPGEKKIQRFPHEMNGPHSSLDFYMNKQLRAAKIIAEYNR